MDDEQAWVDAGLLDPTSGGAEQRRALLQWLGQRGCSLEQMVAADERGRLFGLAGDLQVRPVRPTLSLTDAAARVGITPTLMHSIWRNIGFADVPYDEPVLAPNEAESLSVLVAAVAFFGEQTTLRLSATVGTAVRRIAEAVITAGIDERRDMLLDRSSSELATAQVYEAGMSMTDEFLRFVGTLFRLHHEAGNRHVEMGLLLGDTPGQTVRLTVGFADLSGYTQLVLGLSRPEVAKLVNRFGAWASDVVTEAGSRVVQQLGDAVMFVGSPESACQAAVELVAGPSEGGLPPLRAGLAFGDVVLTGGDYYGPVVNLAARLTADALPGQVLADRRLADRLGGSWELTPGEPRKLKGIDEPEPAVLVSRRV